MATRALLLSFLLVFTTAACATRGSGVPTRNPDVLTRAEIEASDHSNAYDLVRNARPAWLRVRGPNSFNAPNPILVYVDGVRYGTIESLSSLALMGIERMRFYDGPEAQGRFGLNHTNGAIEVTMRRQ